MHSVSAFRGACAFRNAVRILVLVAAVVIVGIRPAIGEERPKSETQIVPMLWQVSGRIASVFLYGSIHLAPPEAVPPPEPVRTAFSRSARLFTEVPIDEGFAGEVQLQMVARMFLPDDVRLSDILTEDEWRRVADWATEADLAPWIVDGMQPWVVELMVAESQALPGSFSAEYGLDDYFSRKAVAAGIPALGLETVAEQLDALSGGEVCEQAASLIAALDQSRDDGQVLHLYQAWRAGDVHALAGLVERAFTVDGDSRQYERFLTDRNERWVETLDGSDGDVFVVVGAAHLVGPKSVPELLADRGYTVRRVLSVDDLQ
jgi:uncharacterized protein